MSSQFLESILDEEMEIEETLVNDKKSQKKCKNDIDYDIVVVPSSMRSLYWKYFGFPADNFNNIITKNKIICVLCGSVIAYNKNTSNLRTHLIAKHSEIWMQLDDERKKVRQHKRIGCKSDRGKNKHGFRKFDTTSTSFQLTQTTKPIVSTAVITDSGGGTYGPNTLNDGNIPSTLTIIHHQNDNNDNRGNGNADNLDFKMPHNVSIITGIQDENIDDVDILDGNTNECNNSTRIIIDNQNNDNLLKNKIEKYENNNGNIVLDIDTNEVEFIDENDFQTYSVTLSTAMTGQHETSNDHNKQQSVYTIEETTVSPATTADDIQNAIGNYSNQQIINGGQRNRQQYQQDIKMEKRFIENNITEMIIKDLLPLQNIEGNGFIEFIRFLNRNCILPKRIDIERNLRQMYDVKFSKLQKLIKTHLNQNQFSLSMEIWKNNKQKTLLSIYINYYENVVNETQKEIEVPVLLNVFYKTIELYQDDRIDRNNLGKLLTDINLKNCNAVVVNNDNDTIKQFLQQHNIPTVLCFESVITSCLEKVFKLSQIENILKRILDDIEKRSEVVEEFATINYLEDNPWSKLNLLNIYYDNSSWDGENNDFITKVKIVKNILQLLKTILETLAEEPIAFCSLIKPFVTKLIEEHFCALEMDKFLIMEIKNAIHQVLKEQIMKNEFYLEAAFFDPRFREFLSSDDMQQVTENLSEKFKDYVQEENKLIKKLKNDNSSLNRRSNLKQFFNRYDRPVVNENVIKNDIKTEILKYVNEVNIPDLDQCPLAWWNEFGCVYRTLKKLSQKYFCIPSCINSIFRCPISNQIRIINNRNNLSGKFIQQLWFLHYNKELI